MFWSAIGFANSPSPSSLLKAVEDHYKVQKFLAADFTQVQWIAALEREKKSKGVLEIGMPGRYRWETQSPDASLIVTNGHRMWYYTLPFLLEGRHQLVIRLVADAQAKFAH